MLCIRITKLNIKNGFKNGFKNGSRNRTETNIYVTMEILFYD